MFIWWRCTLPSGGGGTPILGDDGELLLYWPPCLIFSDPIGSVFKSPARSYCTLLSAEKDWFVSITQSIIYLDHREVLFHVFSFVNACSMSNSTSIRHSGASLLLVFNTFFKTFAPHQYCENFRLHDQPCLQVPDQANVPIFHVFIVLIGFLNRKNTFWCLYSVKTKEKRLKFHSLIPWCGGGHLLSFM